MSKQNNDGKADQSVPAPAAKDAKRKKPGWADGLRQLYDAVLDEPLPDSFAELLAKLDDEGT